MHYVHQKIARLHRERITKPTHFIWVIEQIQTKFKLNYGGSRGGGSGERELTLVIVSFLYLCASYCSMLFAT